MPLLDTVPDPLPTPKHRRAAQIASYAQLTRDEAQQQLGRSWLVPGYMAGELIVALVEAEERAAAAEGRKVERCADLTKYPKGWLRCILPAGHDADPLSMHTIDFADPGEVPDAEGEKAESCARCGLPWTAHGSECRL